MFPLVVREGFNRDDIYAEMISSKELCNVQPAATLP